MSKVDFLFFCPVKDLQRIELSRCLPYKMVRTSPKDNAQWKWKLLLTVHKKGFRSEIEYTKHGLT